VWPTLTGRQLSALAILAGGALGALLRAGLAEAWPVGPGAWPWATFVANLGGAALLAWLATSLSETVAPTRSLRPLLGTGLCGALTTFSAFQVEIIRLTKDGHAAVGVAYALVSLALGMALAAGGTVLARRGRYG
jgi:CrcB protein